MKDVFLPLFQWIPGLLSRNISDYFNEGTVEHDIIKEMKENWGMTDTMTLLNGLTDKYGDKAYEAVDRYFEFIIRKDWSEIGKKEAHDGTEIDDFIRLLWEPIKNLGFEFTIDKNGKDAFFCVSNCPVNELAIKTGMHKWLYHLACATDFYSTTSFSPRINFERSKTLIEGDECCDHRYYYNE
jgi:predicted ArsR family transcriptional regulator